MIELGRLDKFEKKEQQRLSSKCLPKFEFQAKEEEK